MAFDFNSLRKSMQESAENIRQSLNKATEMIPDSVKEINVSETVKDLTRKGQAAFEEAVAKAKMPQQENVTEEKHQTEPESVLPIRDSLRLLYCMIIADGAVSDEEIARFCEIGQELDPEFSSYQETIIEEGTSLMKSSYADNDEYYDSVHDFANDILQSASSTEENGVRGKLLLWDLLTVVYSDGDYSSNEKRLLRLITKRFGIDSAVLLEMEHTLRTLMAMEDEENWLRNSDRSYAVVEERMKEVEDRKNTIMQGVKALIAD